MATVPVITIAHLNTLLDLELEAAKGCIIRQGENMEDAKVIVKYLESFQRRLNQAAFSKIAEIIDKDGAPDA